jgi:leader peptidase (prepilin peptidase) / N-methyltransferase
MAPSLIFLGLLGAAVGSFVNVVIHRLPRGESLVRPRSRCPRCERRLGVLENIPFASWIVLRGRCRGCATPISARYPIVEALTAATFVAVALVRGVDADLLLELPFAATLVTVAAIDLEHRIVPNRIVVPAAVFAVAAAVFVEPSQIPNLLTAGGIAFAALLVAALAYPAGMGMGDVKLAGVMGLYLGAAVAPALLAAFAVGAAVGVVILAREGATARKKGVPFAPFMAIGGFIGLLAGPELVQLYQSHFLA